MVKVLLIDTANHISRTLKTILADEYALAQYSSLDQAPDLLHREHPDIIILDITAANSRGVRYIRALTSSPGYPPIIITAQSADIQEVVQAMRLGVYDFITGPLKIEQLIGTIRKALEYQARTRNPIAIGDRELLDTMIGDSPPFMEVKNLLAAYADTDIPVLLTGESGTGKELAAKTLHALSPRCEGPFIPINCGAIPETLIEGELFGSVKGAFTDARDRKGCFERASGGTLFLDEIGEMRRPAQVKLLRVLEERTVTRVGGSHPIPIDVRIISATNRDLKQAVNRQEFRRDLYYRISILPIPLPPLRERKDDISLLSAYFLDNSTGGKKILSKGAAEKLNNYLWPGNVRELKNVLERAVILSRNSTIDEDRILFL
jgi:DNA-binding NtrC family response regulator